MDFDREGRGLALFPPFPPLPHRRLPWASPDVRLTLSYTSAFRTPPLPGRRVARSAQGWAASPLQTRRLPGDRTVQACRTLSWDASSGWGHSRGTPDFQKEPAAPAAGRLP